MVNSFHPYAAASARFRQLSVPFNLRKKRAWWYEIFDPGSETVSKWNHIFFVICIIGLFLDPLYFFLPVIGGKGCMEIDVSLGIFVTFIRTIADFFYIFHIVFKFRIAFIAPGSRVFGRGQLVKDPWAIAIRYLRKDFSIDLAACLPLPQIMIWFVIPRTQNKTAAYANHTLSLIVLLQYIPRFIQIFPLNQRITKATGAVAKTAWSGAVYNLILFVLTAHIVGSSWYVLSIKRQYECWKMECDKEKNETHSPSCNLKFLDCSSEEKPDRDAWMKNTKVVENCDAINDDKNFEFGMFAEAFTSEVASARFIDKYFYCLWWGMRNLCAYGQDIDTSPLISETSFCIAIAVIGLVLFSHLMSQMQTYLQSTTARLEEWRVKRRDTEEWMRHRQLPPELQERVRRFVQYQWIATRGVDEKAILDSLPLDIRRQIQRHLCLALVRRVPFFAQMDDQLLDAICERLKSSLNTRHTFILREGDPVNEMLFIIRGQLESSTTDGGRTGFFNSITLRAGDFCGEELLTWAFNAFIQSKPSSLNSNTKNCSTLLGYYSHQWRDLGSLFHTSCVEALQKREESWHWDLIREEVVLLPHIVLDQDPDYKHEINNGGDDDDDDSGPSTSFITA
ncbi:hypothetical protein M0R45_024119 [Rubus argutus]|uniref:Cyclic nucleotide-binding domain-containing protein n=1 Tax=Rubus argutus TaxID=59490 RepID=A0AAW1WQ91_RUBAR